MPALLPPLNQSLEAPSFEKAPSDWSEMPKLLPPLMQSYTSDPSEWVPMPDNMVPKAVPQVSWDAGLNEVQSPPSWLRENSGSTFTNIGSDGDPSIPRQFGLVNTREMEILSSGDGTVGMNNNFPVAIPQQNAYFAPIGPTLYNSMIQPMQQMQPQTNALVHFPFISLAASIIQSFITCLTVHLLRLQKPQRRCWCTLCSLHCTFMLQGKFLTPASHTAARQSTPLLCRAIFRPTRRSWAARPATLCKSINSFMFLWFNTAKLYLPPFKVILWGAKQLPKSLRAVTYIFQFSCLNIHFYFFDLIFIPA